MDFERPSYHHQRVSDRHRHYQQQRYPFSHCDNASRAAITSCRTKMNRGSSDYTFSLNGLRFSLPQKQISFLFFILLAVLIVPCTRATVVQTKIGKIRGLEEETSQNTKYFAFKGIRYASSPVKELRFRVIIPQNRHEKMKKMYWLQKYL